MPKYDNSISGAFDPGITNGRLTLATATPITVTDQTAKTTVYFTPFQGNRISLYDGVDWQDVSFAEVSCAVPSNADTPFDIFGYLASGTLAIEALAWTNDSTRATVLTTQNGIYSKTGALTRKYLGTGRTTGVSGQTEVSTSSCLLWNYYNRRRRFLNAKDTTDSWAYTTATWQEFRAQSTLGTSRVGLVIGVAEDEVEATVQGMCSNATPCTTAVGVGVDSSTVNSAQYMAGSASAVTGVNTAKYLGFPAAGYHTLRALEISAATGATTWYGDVGLAYWQSGLLASLMA